MKSALERIESPLIRESELGSMTLLNGKVSIVAQSNGWVATLIRKGETTKFINSAPFPTIIVPLGIGNEVEIASYYLPREELQLASLAKSAMVAFSDKFLYSEAHPFANFGKHNSYAITNIANEMQFLRITGPNYAPYIHFFDIETLNYTHTALATQEFTSRLFYSEAIKQILYRVNCENLTSDERESLICFMGAKVNAETDMPNEVWNFLQALFVLDKTYATDKIRLLTESEGPLKDVALATLHDLEA